jgi:ribosome assembly protein RRB1
MKRKNDPLSTHKEEAEEDDHVEFEDPFEDELEEEDIYIRENDDEDDELMDEDDAEGKGQVAKDVSVVLGKDVYRPGIDAIDEDEELDYDPSAYILYLGMSTDWPCLSFDIVPDRLGMNRTKFPLSFTLVSGTQAEKASQNKLMVMRVSNMHKTQELDEKEGSDDDDDDDDDDESLDEDPVLETQYISHNGGVNRVRVMPQEPHVVATWAETGKVHLFDIRPQVKLLDASEGKGIAPSVPRDYGPVYTCSSHGAEGFALDWSKAVPGKLASGDVNGSILVWDANAEAAMEALKQPAGSGSLANVWSVNHSKSSFSTHKSSVEDIQWSPNESTVFASCSSDQTIKIWDTRVPQKSMLSVHGADSDINVISWSTLVTYLLASGSDDGGFKIWDLRSFKGDCDPIASFKWHSKQVTSIEWAPDDENELLVSSADNQVTLWDLSLEADEEAEVVLSRRKQQKADQQQSKKSASDASSKLVPSTHDPRLADIPPQLLFQHAGQRDIKEAHFHKQIPGLVISTAADGFNFFKPDVFTTT